MNSISTAKGFKNILPTKEAGRRGNNEDPQTKPPQFHGIIDICYFPVHFKGLIKLWQHLTPDHLQISILIFNGSNGVRFGKYSSDSLRVMSHVPTWTTTTSSYPSSGKRPNVIRYIW